MRFSWRSRIAVFVGIFPLGLIVSVSLSHKVYAQSSTNFLLYDNFDERFLSPLKWAFGACFAQNGAELECVREIRDEKLHLAHRTFGNRDTNTGFQSGQAVVFFANPSRIKGIASDLAVLSVAESNCPANQSFEPAVHIDGNFFNTGSGNSSDDIGGHIALQADPSGSVFVFAQISQGNNYFFFLPLGNSTTGTPIRATLTWDQPNHRFLVSWTDLLTNIKTEGIMPYSFTSDSTPATNPLRILDVVTFPANCTANPTWQYIHATFSNVYVM